MGQVTLTMYELFNPEPCVPSKGMRCILPYQKAESKFDLSVYTSTVASKNVRETDLMLAHRQKEFDLADELEM